VELAGQKVLVVGLGKSGVAAARLLAEKGARVIGNDQREEHELSADALALRGAGVELSLGGHPAALFTSVDRIVTSPGVPALPALRAAEDMGVPIASEIELASWFVRAPILGVTGTNGKSTVTTLVGEMCQASGRSTFVGGNLGTPLVDVVGTPRGPRHHRLRPGPPHPNTASRLPDRWRSGKGSGCPSRRFPAGPHHW
jgi:UDP-N-acetylmuramoylalanine--D-glutamate ligase